MISQREFVELKFIIAILNKYVQFFTIKYSLIVQLDNFVYSYNWIQIGSKEDGFNFTLEIIQIQSLIENQEKIRIKIETILSI